jgi:hypothetical protein
MRCTSLPAGFHKMKSLEDIHFYDFSGDPLKELETMTNLRSIKLDLCEHITRLPDISALVHLTEFRFD